LGGGFDFWEVGFEGEGGSGEREEGRGLAAAAEEKVRKVAERSASRAVRGRSAMVMTQERGRWVAAVNL
jgi:hypothetical protein